MDSADKLWKPAKRLIQTEKPILVAVGIGIAGLVVYGQYAKEQEILRHTKDYNITRVLDGDTVEITAPFLPPPLKKTLLLRIEGVDTPESGHLAKCNKEERRADQAKKFTYDSIYTAKAVSVRINKWDKYGGRVIGDILINGEKLSKKLIDKRLAVEYNGQGDKKDWCK